MGVLEYIYTHVEDYLLTAIYGTTTDTHINSGLTSIITNET